MVYRATQNVFGVFVILQNKRYGAVLMDCADFQLAMACVRFKRMVHLAKVICVTLYGVVARTKRLEVAQRLNLL
tara:strand:+ start:260 stop:481 length:222 start_codon:yes stop_codon:yes gene_type:complete